MIVLCYSLDCTECNEIKIGKLIFSLTESQSSLASSPVLPKIQHTKQQEQVQWSFISTMRRQQRTCGAMVDAPQHQRRRRRSEGRAGQWSTHRSNNDDDDGGGGGKEEEVRSIFVVKASSIVAKDAPQQQRRQRSTRRTCGAMVDAPQQQRR